jgi:hypothetical protein
MKIKYPEIGVCGLSCRLCPSFHMTTKSRCLGCKSDFRMSAGCPFITCALKQKGVEFCWDCSESRTCQKWQQHRELGKRQDSFKCYQKLEADIASIQKYGVFEFEKLQKTREKLLQKMLKEFNDGRSKSYYCIVATILEIEELETAISYAQKNSSGLDLKEKSKLLHSRLDDIATKKNYCLRLRHRSPQKWIVLS